VEGTALFVVDDNRTTHLPPVTGLQPKRQGTDLAYLFSSEKLLGALAEDYAGLALWVFLAHLRALLAALA
jgi:hypothetical protein